MLGAIFFAEDKNDLGVDLSVLVGIHDDGHNIESLFNVHYASALLLKPASLLVERLDLAEGFLTPLADYKVKTRVISR